MISFYINLTHEKKNKTKNPNVKTPSIPEQEASELKHIKKLGQVNQIISGSIQATAENFKRSKHYRFPFEMLYQAWLIEDTCPLQCVNLTCELISGDVPGQKTCRKTLRIEGLKLRPPHSPQNPREENLAS